MPAMTRARTRRDRNRQEGSTRVFDSGFCIVCLQVWGKDAVPVTLACGHVVCRRCCYRLWLNFVGGLPRAQQQLMADLVMRYALVWLTCPLYRRTNCIQFWFIFMYIAYMYIYVWSCIYFLVSLSSVLVSRDGLFSGIRNFRFSALGVLV